MSTFGERLRSCRENAVLSAVEVAKRADVSPQYLNDLEFDRRRCPSLEVVERLANAIGVYIEALDPEVRVPLSLVCLASDHRIVSAFLWGRYEALRVAAKAWREAEAIEHGPPAITEITDLIEAIDALPDEVPA